MIVLKGDYRIVLNKFFKGMGYALAVLLITIAINYLSGDLIPLEYSLYGTLGVILLQAILKGLQQYKPEYAEQFQWFFEKVIEAIQKNKDVKNIKP
jgi:hypothetical protein